VHHLAAGALDGTALVAHREAPATAQATAFEDVATIFGLHALHEAMLTPAWDTLGLPSSFGHDQTSSQASLVLATLAEVMEYTHNTTHVW
jgi:hypothetical protein